MKLKIIILIQGLDKEHLKQVFKIFLNYYYLLDKDKLDSFVDLLKGLLQYDPYKRWKPS